jgi:Lrp/AsnC family transcriptional regulator for asnA, asnC and gidA
MKDNENLDDTDKKILKIINKDSRTPYKQISKELNVSIGTIHNRIEKLTKKGVIKKFTTSMDYNKIGYNLTAIIGIKIKGGQIKKLKNKTIDNNSIIALYDITGKYDALIIAKFKNTSDLDKFIKTLLKEDNIERTYTQIVLNVVKEDFDSANIL